MAMSVMCAPIRHAERILGLIHLASTNPARAPDPDDLEFTLAVAETVGVAVQNLSQKQELTENLNQIRDENLQLRERLGGNARSSVESADAASEPRNQSRRAEQSDRARFAAKAASAKNSSRGRCIIPARARRARLSA